MQWATTAGYGIIDVNVPSHITDPTSNDSFTAPLPQSSLTDPESIENQTKDLLCHLWDHFIAGYACDTIVVMGVGNAYIGAKQLLISRGTSLSSLLCLSAQSTTQETKHTPLDARSRIACILSFVTGTLRPVKSETDSQLSPWYKAHSRIYVSPDHSCWTDPDSVKKVRKNRFGGVRQSEVAGLSSMLAYYERQACVWVDEMVRQRWVEMGLGENGEGMGDDETESEGRE